jgi:small subunit ribosomal protein S8
MTIQDPISDMFIRIKNAAMIYKKNVSIPLSRQKKAILDVLLHEGFIRGFDEEELNGKSSIKVSLKYFRTKNNVNEHVINSLTRVSKPSRRVYSSCKEWPVVNGGLGATIVTTSKGVMTAKKARSLSLGGEVIAEVF